MERSNNCLAIESQLQVNLLIDFVTDVILAFFDENNFIDIIKFLEQELIRKIQHWFKSLQNINHEILEFKVTPCVKAVSISS